MKTKILTWLKYCLFTVFLAAALCAVLLFIFILEFNYFVVSSILGDWVFFTIFFIILPIITFAVPFIIKIITKCSFSKLILSVIATILIYWLLYAGTHCICAEYCKSFTPEKWGKYPNERHYMIDDLTEKHDIIGMTRDELTSLLGEPDALTVSPENHAEYHFNSAFLYSENIVFVFENDKVSEWYIDEIDF